MDFLNSFIDYYREAFTDHTLDVLLGLFLIFVGFLFELKLLGIGSVKVYAELFNVKDAEIRGGGYGFEGSTYYSTIRTYMPGIKTPLYRYKYKGKLYVSTPKLISNRASYNPLPGPCYIYINRRNPKHIYSPELKGVFHIISGMGLVTMLLPFILNVW
ncbi:MAG: hypothetical protein II926_05060 [Bacteroidales bacterium]|nr:hypothetical protein [Bacteroidales bacterium]